MDVKDKDDGISLNSKYRGREVRRGEKLYKFYSYVQENEKYRNIKYIAKMDDDVIVCPELFQYLKTNGINNQSYAGMFQGLKRAQEIGISRNAKADEMFVILGRTIMYQILSKEYCYDTNEETCNSKDQRFDTNMGGQSLGLWLSSVKDVHILPLNDVALYEGYNNSKSDILVHHLSRKYNKDLSLIQRRYDQCR